MQQRQLRRFAGSCRFVYNQALALPKERYERGEKRLGYAGLCKELTAWRNGAPLPSGRTAAWLADAPVHPLQQTLKDLERAYANFFAKHAGVCQHRCRMEQLRPPPITARMGRVPD